MANKVIEETIVTFGVHRGWDHNLVTQQIAPQLAGYIEKALVAEVTPRFDVDAIVRRFENEFGYLGNFWEKWADGSLPDQGGIMADVKKFLHRELAHHNY